MSEHYREQALEIASGFIDMKMNDLQRKYPNLSHIEQGMLYGLVALSIGNPAFSLARANFFPSETEFRAQIHIQHPIGKYRTDFAIHLTAESGGKALSEWFAVECDGYQFHHQTREQVTRDKVREREIIAAGFKVLRFSGTELHRDLPNAIAEIMLLMVNTYVEWRDKL